MATFTLTRRSLAVNEAERTADTTVPANPTRVRVMANVTTAQMRNAATDFELHLECAFDGSTFVAFARSRLQGRAVNQNTQQAYVEIDDPQILPAIAGKSVRGVLIARTAGAYGAVVDVD